MKDKEIDVFNKKLIETEFVEKTKIIFDGTFEA